MNLNQKFEFWLENPEFEIFNYFIFEISNLEVIYDGNFKYFACFFGFIILRMSIQNTNWNDFTDFGDTDILILGDKNWGYF